MSSIPPLKKCPSDSALINKVAILNEAHQALLYPRPASARTQEEEHRRIQIAWAASSIDSECPTPPRLERDE